MKKIYKNPLVILILGIIIIAASSAGAARAAIIYQTEAERVNFSTATFSIDLQEKVDGDYVSLGEESGLSFPEIVADENIKIGKKYVEDVRVVNNSNPETGYKEYVRVVVRKSWFKDGKSTKLDPELIKLEVADGWFLNEAESTKETSVYYRTTPLNCGDTSDFITGITVDNKVTTYVDTKSSDITNDGGIKIGTNIEYEYLYNGQEVYLQLQADAVQTHNSENAIYAAWGINATCDAQDDGTITAIGGVATH